MSVLSGDKMGRVEKERCFALEWDFNFWKSQLPKLVLLRAEESYGKPYFLFAVRKCLHHFQPKKADSSEEQPILIRRIERTSHPNAHKRPLILNRPLSSHLNSHFLSTTTRPRGMEGFGKPPSACVALSRHQGALPDRTQVALSHLPRCCHLPWMQQLCKPFQKSGTKEFLSSEDLHEDQMRLSRRNQGNYRGARCCLRLPWITTKETGPLGRQRNLNWNPTGCQGFSLHKHWGPLVTALQ